MVAKNKDINLHINCLCKGKILTMLTDIINSYINSDSSFPLDVITEIQLLISSIYKYPQDYLPLNKRVIKNEQNG